MVAEMTPHQQVFAVILAVLLLVFVVDLVRRRQLKEEYSWLWLLASVVVLFLVAWPAALVALSRAIGSTTEATTVSVLGLMFLTAVIIHLCTKLTRLDQQVRELAQELAILRAQEPEDTQEAGEGQTG